MPNTYRCEIIVTTDTDQRGQLHGRQNLSPVGFWFTEIATRLRGDAKLRGFKVNNIDWAPIDKPQLPFENQN